MRYRVHEGETLVGRGSRVAFFLDDASVSREHALVRRIGETVTLTDLSSSNGTFVNGERLLKTRKLALGDRIKLGSAELRFGVTRGVAPLSHSPGIELIEQGAVRKPVMDLSTEPQFGSLDVLESLVQNKDKAESIAELVKMIRASVDRLLDGTARGRLTISAVDAARVATIADQVASWQPSDELTRWATEVKQRVAVAE